MKFIFLFLALTGFANAKVDFAFVTKSFHRDLDRSLVMYQSVEKYFQGDVPFYFVVPNSEIGMFKNFYNNAISDKKIQKSPIFLSEEGVFAACNVKKAILDTLPGWHKQQVVKLCFFSTNLAKDYMTIDSDIYFVRNFDKSLFYKDGILKTVGMKLGNCSEKAGVKKFLKLKRNLSSYEERYRYHSHSFMRYVMDSGNKPWHNFVSGFALWSSEALTEMATYIAKVKKLDMADLINLVPWEMQWYGEFIQSKRPDKFYLFDQSFVSGIGDLHEDAKFTHCTPTNGFYGAYGIQYQPHAEGRKGNIYECPNTLKCKIKNAFRYAVYKLSIK